jgi:hypothetical protein
MNLLTVALIIALGSSNRFAPRYPCYYVVKSGSAYFIDHRKPEEGQIVSKCYTTSDEAWNNLRSRVNKSEYHP